MQDAYSIIRTKLHQPFTRKKLVSRNRLHDQINLGLHCPLTLVTAPAGFGKTTLISSSLKKIDMPVGWLSLDKSDNQAERFLNYLIATLKAADKNIGSDAAHLMAGNPQPAPEVVLTSLVNDLDGTNADIVLVLDDYQVINSQAVHEHVNFLLEHCPTNFHLVIATRSDPPLPLARLRARGQMIELRAADLRFTKAESALFLNEVMGLGLDDDLVTVLEGRTEGWIAGLQMAALSLQDRQDIPGFIEGFSGTNRYIMDYLLEEILASQPEGYQRFLLNTSILEHLSAGLCDTLSGIGGWQVESSHELTSASLPSQSILENLERSNLFLIPLDDERQWFRYHQLFVDLLRSRLHQTQSLEEIAELHKRAAQWYDNNGLVYEAIHHASLIPDNALVDHLIEKNYMEIFQRSASASIRYWTGELSREMILKHPRLSIHEAMSLSWLGQLDEADQFLDEAEKRLTDMSSAAETEALFGYLAYVRSRAAAMRGKLCEAIELCLTAREHTLPDNQALLGGIGVLLGYVYFLDGDFTKAIPTLIETIHSGKRANAINTTMAAYCVLARLYGIQGKLHKAFELYKEAGNYAAEVKGQNLGITGIVDVGIAGILYEWNDLDAAQTHIKQGFDFISSWDKADDTTLAYTTQAQIHLAQGNLNDAVESIGKGIQVIHTNGVFSEARDAVETMEIRVHLETRNLQVIDHWLGTREKDLELCGTFRFENEAAHLTLARIYLFRDKLHPTITLLSDLEEKARASGRQGRLIEILNLKAIALEKMGEHTQALELLGDVLSLAAPEGYIRIFVDEGEPMRILLAQWAVNHQTHPLREYAARLCSYFGTALVDVTVLQDKAPAISKLVEPISQRELEVLQLMAMGKTNQEIAEQLIIAKGTVKAHAASIFRKLDVSNRTEAADRARQLGLLS